MSSYYQFQGQLQGDSIFGLDDDEARRRRRHASRAWEPYQGGQTFDAYSQQGARPGLRSGGFGSQGPPEAADEPSSAPTAQVSAPEPPM